MNKIDSVTVTMNKFFDVLPYNKRVESCIDVLAAISTEKGKIPHLHISRQDKNTEARNSNENAISV